MKKIPLIVSLIILFTLVFILLNPNKLYCYTQKTIASEALIKLEPPEPPESQISPDLIKLIYITNWDEDIAEFFISEAQKRNVLVFAEALPIIAIETGNTYRFDLINKNNNGTRDIGVFQINDLTMIDIIKGLETEGEYYDNWDRFNPEINIKMGMYWISHLKNNYQLENHQLFTSYNKGINGGRQHASRSGSYVSNYSKKVKEVKNELTELELVNIN